MEKQKTAVLFTAHQWSNYRTAGFHMIARALAENGYGVCFASSPVSWTGVFRQGDQFGARKLIPMACAGKTWPVERGFIRNITTFSMALPGPFRSRLSEFTQWCERRAISKLIDKSKRLFPSPDFVFIESIPLVTHFRNIVSSFPNSKLIYRPSDPLVARPLVSDAVKRGELDVVKNVDLLATVNEQAVALYRENGVVRSDNKHTIVLPNGFDQPAYQKNWPVPDELKSMARPIATYVGASAPYWEALIELAEKNPRFSVTVICPVKLPKSLQARVLKCGSKLNIIEGVAPHAVPGFVTNSDVIVVTYPPECAQWTRGLHSKLYQAIAAGKPIVGLNMGLGIDSENMQQHINKDDFVSAFENLDTNAVVDYGIDLSSLDWSHFRKKLMAALTTL